jgi:hypothetical protein
MLRRRPLRFSVSLTSPSGRKYITHVVKQGDSSVGAGIRGQEPYFEGPQVRICTRLPVVAATPALHNTPLAVTRRDWGSEVVVPGLHEVVELTYLTELNHCKR